MIRSLPLGRAMVTGASSAIGAIYAHRLASRGFDLVLASADPHGLDRFAEWIVEQTGSVIEIVASSGDSTSDIAALEQRLARDPDLNMLVNHAAEHLMPDRADPGAIETLIRMSQSAPVRLAYAAATAFAGRSGGTIVNLGPVAAPRGPQPGVAETASRAFLRSLSQALDSELRRSGVRVQAVLPPSRAASFWTLGASRIEQFPREVVQLAEDLVHQALAALDNGEVVTRPRLPEDVFARLGGSGTLRSLQEARG